MADPAENSTDNSTAAPGKPFVKGKSGNPGGRPKGFARKVREIAGTNDGETMARLWYSAAMSGYINYVETAADGVVSTTRVKVDISDRLAATRWLVDRGWGKTPAFAPIEDDDPLELEERTAERARLVVQEIDELASRRAAKTG